MTPQELVSAFESWCIESQIENTFCTSAKNKLAEMIHARDMSQKEQKSDVCSRVQLPERSNGSKDCYDGNDSCSHDSLSECDANIMYDKGFNDCLDAIELIPLSNEDLLPSEQQCNDKAFEIAKTAFDDLGGEGDIQDAIDDGDDEAGCAAGYSQGAALIMAQWFRQHIQAAIGVK